MDGEYAGRKKMEETIKKEDEEGAIILPNVFLVPEDRLKWYRFPVGFVAFWFVLGTIFGAILW